MKTAHIAVRTNGSFNKADWKKVKGWKNIDKVWSTTGTWDWFIKTKDNADWNGIKQLVWDLRNEPWVAATETWWSEEV